MGSLCFAFPTPVAFRTSSTETLVCYLLQPAVNKYQDKIQVERRPNVILLPTEKLQTCLWEPWPSEHDGVSGQSRRKTHSSCRPTAEQRVVSCLEKHFLLALFRDFDFRRSVSAERWKSCISDSRCPQWAGSAEALPRLCCMTHGGQQPRDKGCVINIKALTMPLGFYPHPLITFGLLQPLRPTCNLLILPFASAHWKKKKKVNFSPFQI